MAGEGTWEDLFRPAIQRWHHGAANSALVVRAYRLSILYEKETQVRENISKLISDYPDTLVHIERLGPESYKLQEEAVFIDYHWINKHSIGEKISIDGYMLFVAEQHALAKEEPLGPTPNVRLSERSRVVTKVLKFYLGPDIVRDMDCEVVLDQRNGMMTAFFDISGGRSITIGRAEQYYFLNREIPKHRSMPEFFYEAIDLAHKAETSGETTVAFVLWCAAFDCICGSTENQRKSYFEREGLDDHLIKRDITKISAFRGSFLHNGLLIDVSKSLDRLVLLVRLISLESGHSRDALLQDYRSRFAEPLIAPWENN